MKMRKRILSVVLALALLFSLAVVPAAADGEQTVRQFANYLPLGDSIAAACTLEGYDFRAEGNWVSGAYVSAIKELVGATNEKTGDLQGGRSGWRTHELRLMLDDSYLEEYLETQSGYLPAMVDRMRGTEDQDILQLRDTYRKAVCEADLITLQIGSNDIMSYVVYQLMEYFGARSDNAMFRVFYQELEKLLMDRSLNPEMRGSTEDVSAFKIISAILEKAFDSDFYDEMVQLIRDVLETSYREFCENWDVIIDRILSMNPDASVLVLGMYNPVGNVLGLFGEVLVTPVISAINYYIHFGSPLSLEYGFVDLSTSLGDGNISEDGLHPNLLGHSIIVRKITEALKLGGSCKHEHPFTVFTVKNSMLTPIGYTGDVFCLDCGAQLDQGVLITPFSTVELPKGTTTILFQAMLVVVTNAVRMLIPAPFRSGGKASNVPLLPDFKIQNTEEALISALMLLPI